MTPPAIAGTAPGATGGANGLVLYVREGCHLCDAFLVDLELDPDLPGARAMPELVDVDGDPTLALEFGLRVPVLVLAGRVLCEGRYDSARVRGALQV